MGVNGLTTYLRNNRLAIAKNVELRSQDPNDTQNRASTHIVIDGWSFIYQVYNSATTEVLNPSSPHRAAISQRLPWAYGGEYDQFSAVIQKIVHAWLGLGIHLSFVFDGPEEPIKFPTCVSRLTSTQVHNSELFFRTSRAARTTPRFLGETRIIPPLVYPACVETLLKLSSESRGADVYFADREADPFIVELAGRLGAYVAAVDSDFVVLNAPGYRGYISLDELEWKLDPVPQPMRTRTTSIVSSAASFSISDFGSDASILDDLAEFDNGEFVPVHKKRSRKISTKARLNPAISGQVPTQRTLIPPEEYSAIIFPVYTPETVAASLGIPAALLPLLGAIVGNDFTQSIKPLAGKRSPAPVLPSHTHRKLLFDHKLTAPQRVVFAANNLSSVLRGTDRKRKNSARAKQRSVLDLIRSTVSQMLVHPDHTTEKQIDDIVNGIVESALQYAIPPPPLAAQGKHRLWPTPFCPLHEDVEQCQLEPFIPETVEDDVPKHSPTLPQHQDVLSMVQNLYLRKYREGSLDSMVLDVLVTGTMWPRLFLENPDHMSASGELEAGGALRRWVYAIVDQGIGVYVPPPSEEDEDEDSGDVAESTNGHMDHQTESSEEGDDDEVIDVVDEDDLSDAGDPLVALKGALQRLRGVSSAGMSGGLPTIPDQGDDSSNEGESVGDDDDALEECYVTEYVRRGGRVAEISVLVPDLNTLLEQAIERKVNGGDATTSENFGRQSMHNHHSVPRTSRSHPIQLAEEKERLCVLLMACASDTQRVRSLDSEWVGPVIVTRWLIRWAGVAGKEKGGSSRFLADPLLKTWARGEIAALLRAFRSGDEGDVSTRDDSSASGALEMSDRAIQLMARALSVIEATRMLIQVLCLTSRVPLHLARFQGRVFHEGCRQFSGAADNNAQRSAPIDAEVLTAVEEGLEEYIRDDWVKKGKKKKNSPPVPQVKPMQRGVSFNLLASLDASA